MERNPAERPAETAAEADRQARPTEIAAEADRQARWLTALLGWAEDLVYAATAVLLGAASLVALVTAAIGLAGGVLAGGGTGAALGALESVLLVLIFIELFYTVRLSIREHSLAVEPIVAVALIATVRRILVLAAEERKVLEGDAETFNRAMIELGLLALLVVVLTGAIIALRRWHGARQPIAGE
jgi:uncharacterized membrane protein (DUF373 family)